MFTVNNNKRYNNKRVQYDYIKEKINQNMLEIQLFIFSRFSCRKIDGDQAGAIHYFYKLCKLLRA